MGENMTVRRVTKRVIGPDGNVAGTYDKNPYLNSMIYEVEFYDRQVQEYAANIIAENILTQADAEGFSLMLMKAIIDHRKYEFVAIPKSDMYFVTRRGGKKRRKMTIGW